MSLWLMLAALHAAPLSPLACIAAVAAIMFRFIQALICQLKQLVGLSALA